MNLILLTADELVDEKRAALAGPRAAHLIRVLKVRPGDGIRIGRINGPRGTGTVNKVTEGGVEIDCAFEAEAPSRPAVDLLLALPRPKVMKRLWAQLAAIGVGRIILTNAARVERNYFDTHVLDAALYTPLLLEGLQQARDTRLPDVTLCRQFKPLVEDQLPMLTDATTRLIADPGSGGHAARPELPPGRILLAVGPEGGWVPFERELLARHGFQPFSLGARTLRTDTACIALLALVHHHA